MAIHSRFWKIFDSILLIAVVVIGAWAMRGYLLSNNSPTLETSQLSSVNVSIVYGNGDTKQGSVGFDSASSSPTVLSALKMATALQNVDIDTKNYPGMGTIVTRIGSDTNGSGGAYWQFWVNGQYADKAADQTTVNSGDNIEWRFSSSQQ